MTRDLSASVLAEIESDEVQLALFFEGEFESGTVRIWTGVSSIDWNGNTWTGLGNLIGLSLPDETSDITANSLTVQLSGVDPSFVALVQNDARQGLKGRVWVGFLKDTSGDLQDETGAPLLAEDGSQLLAEAETLNILADPFQMFVGRLDVPTIEDGENKCTISISYENRLIDLNRPRDRRYTHEDQKIDYPDDKFFEYISSIQDQEITWGR